MGDDSSDQPQTVTTRNVLGPEQQALTNLAMPNWMKFATTPYSLPGAAGVAGFDPAQTAGQQAVLGSTGAQSGIVGGAGDANQFLTSGAALDPRTNPGLAGTIDASVRPIYQNLTESVLPAIRGQAAVGASGPSANYGGSRQGIAEGLAARGASTAAGDVAQKTAFGGYQTGLDAMLRAIGLAPSTAGAQTIPGLTQSAVGAERQGMEQKLLSAEQQAGQFAWMLPFIRGQALTGAAAGTGGGTNISTGPPPQQPSTMDQIIGGGLTAGALLGGMGQAGTGLAAAAPYLPFLMSDMRLKRNIVRIGTLFDGTPVYRYCYAGNDVVHIGLMAQDVEKKVPEAVKEIGSFKLVNYDLATRPAMEAYHEPVRSYADDRYELDRSARAENGSWRSATSDAGDGVRRARSGDGAAARSGGTDRADAADRSAADGRDAD